VDAIPWGEFDDPTLVQADRAGRSYPTAFEATSFSVDRTELLVAPDNAEHRILDAIENADDSIDIKQVRIGDRSFPLLQAVIDAAKRGVEVRILLDGSWYVEDENRNLKAWLEEQASVDDLPDRNPNRESGDSFEKIHAKGMIIDGERTLVGSINWNNNSVRNNREVALLIESPEVAVYFSDVFETDWKRDRTQKLPVGLGLTALFVGVLAAIGASRMRFEP